ncbi:helix-turn-helix domain-containing protein [Candidatus Woesearchaeota archaeon]|nr:helix-turn-helix domain-containing protein [Candidatus Woesearchaeota archaeon]
MNMSKKSFLLVSLKENKAKKLAEVISNKTCRKILDYLADKKDATESDIAKELNVPLSTVHYNMKALVEARLVKSDEYHYSAKGKEVSHYRLANQYVIIAPEGEKHAIREKLKSIIPTALIMGAAAGIIKLFSGTFRAVSDNAAPLMMKSVATGAVPPAEPMMYEVAEEAAYEATQMAADEAVMEAAPAAQQMVVERAPMLAEHTPEAIETGRQAASNVPEIALWFFIGAVAGVAVYLIVDYIVKRIRNR